MKNYYNTMQLIFIVLLLLCPGLILSQENNNEYKGVILSISFKDGFGNTDYNGIAKLRNNNKAYAIDILYYSDISDKVSVGAGISQMAWRFLPQWNVSTLVASVAYSPINSYRRIRITPQLGYSLKLGESSLKGFTTRVRIAWDTRIFNSNLVNIFIGCYLQQSQDQEARLIPNPQDPNPSVIDVKADVIYKFYSLGISFNF